MDSPNLKLPYILAAQAQKHVTHNEAIRMLDALVQLAVMDKDLATPPGSPADGARYIVAASPTGAWSGQAGRIAAFQDGAWEFLVPREGWLAWVSDENLVYAHDGSAWVPYAGGGGGGGSVNPTPLVGVNATADTTNRLSVASPSVLFNHEGAGHQLKINKAAAANTASLLFQDAFSGRAEIGLTGDDDLHYKVSADGSAWKDALIINRSTGVVSMPFTPSGGSVGENLAINGDFQLNIYGYTGTVLASGSFGRDRWKASGGNAQYSVSGYTVTLSTGTIEQVIETAFWGYSSLASTAFTVSVDTPSADLTVNVGASSGTITAGSGRRSVTITTGAGDTGNISVKLTKATAGTVTFGRVKVEIGSAATPWVARNQQREQQLCQRYAPGFRNVSGSLEGLPGAAATFNSSTGLYWLAPFVVPPRIPPTGILTGAVGTFRFGSVTGAQFGTSVSLAIASLYVSQVNFTTTSPGGEVVSGFATAGLLANGFIIWTGCEL